MPNNVHLSVRTNNEIARSVCMDILVSGKNDTLEYFDVNGVICNRIGRLIRERIISKDNVDIVYIEKGKQMLRFKYNDNGQIVDCPIGFFDANDDSDAISAISDKFNSIL